eukprot:GHVN01050493.1.p2 GENE.GHVN01050493.1~~GHVN01050493.1.p2  ORF type:complete len:212 (-),score=44.52 GHVN01050493.1:131-766(-)
MFTLQDQTGVAKELANTTEMIDENEKSGLAPLCFTKYPSDIPHVTPPPEHKTERAVYFEESIDDLRDVFNYDRVCLLDMDAPDPLTPSDGEAFEWYLFGGICGNVPSDDRTQEIRRFKFSGRRHLGVKQMTTDTALLVTKIVVEDGVDLKAIPYVDDPEVETGPCEVTQIPFRYVSMKYLTGEQADKDVAWMCPGMREHLADVGDSTLDDL